VDWSRKVSQTQRGKRGNQKHLQTVQKNALPIEEHTGKKRVSILEKGEGKGTKRGKEKEGGSAERGRFSRFRGGLTPHHGGHCKKREVGGGREKEGKKRAIPPYNKKHRQGWDRARFKFLHLDKPFPRIGEEVRKICPVEGGENWGGEGPE